MRALSSAAMLAVVMVLPFLLALIALLFLLQLCHFLEPGATEKCINEMLAAVEAIGERDRPEEKKSKEKKTGLPDWLNGAEVLSSYGGGVATTYNPNADQAYAAMMALGYRKADAEEKMKKALRALPPEATVEELIKKALQP